ncbi:aromatic ring-hydroxylating oxygenase subunit alpha [Campylobacter jejuni]|uniref:Rieske domain-containing protein n=4 Tax=Campylobacter jejuni TaxID=197 RepID=A0AB36G5D2_CAMJU|nr:SRPBCC family protein [Campylobacter jejuni]EMA2808808.1 Rieske 2Fe-2S domain-containing protein [Campylobacter jejuni]OEV44651.1 hypothetical protein AJY60_10220 [Campylobacter jejuni]RTI75863.1 hypothetical protein C3I12_01805 [Campylobacter jejuni]RTI89376.1 hypothetical protein C3I07_00135 [Campylobacter jejuni]RTJ22322.1 hypothetical protein C3H86_07760 [Campylobacter jejuni]
MMHYWDYNSEETQKLEFEKLYKKFWHFGVHISELKNDKDYAIVKMYDFEIIFYNDNDNIIAFYNVCPHRGAKLLQFEGNEGICYGNAEIKCQYHHWTYKYNKLVIPARSEFEDGNSKLDLFKLNIDFCGNFIFFSHKPKLTLREQLGDYYSEIYDISQSIKKFIGLNAPIKYDSNWKVGIENSLEAYHIDYVHPHSLGILHVKDEPNYSGVNSKTNAKINNNKIYLKLEKVKKIFDKKNYTDNKYFSYHLFPFVIVSSTFGYAYSIQNYFPCYPNKTYFISRNYIAKANLDVEAFSREVIAMNKIIFEEDAQVCDLVHGSLFLNNELKYNYAKKLEERIMHFHKQYKLHMEF